MRRTITMGGSWRIYGGDTTEIRKAKDHLDTKGKSLITAADITQRLDAIMAKLANHQAQEIAKESAGPEVIVFEKVPFT